MRKIGVPGVQEIIPSSANVIQLSRIVKTRREYDLMDLSQERLLSQGSEVVRQLISVDPNSIS